MTNNAQLLPLPELSDDDLELLHYNPNTSDVVEFLHRYAQSYALANLQSAKPADALGSLPVPPYIYGRECAENEHVYTEQQMLSLHAQATAEIAMRDAEIEAGYAVRDDLRAKLIEADMDLRFLRAKVAKLSGVDGLAEALRDIAGDSDDPGAKLCASHALATYEAAQETK